MGNFENSSKPFQYGVFLDEVAKEGETQILRRFDTAKNGLIKSDPFNIGTVLGAFERCLKRFPNKKFVGQRKHIKGEEYGEYEWKTYAEIDSLSNYFLYGITELGMCPEVESDKPEEKYKFFGIYSRNRIEWLIADFACQKDSITIVTIYDTLGIGAVEYIFKQTNLTSIIMESRALNKIIDLTKQKKIGNLQNIVVIPSDSDTTIEANMKTCEELGLKMYYFDDIIKRGKEYDQKVSEKPEFKKATPDTIITFCYTSGTTGDPKGAMIPNNSLMSCVTAMESIGIKLVPEDVYLSFLPLAHIMEQLIISAILVYGCQIGFFSGSPLRITEDAKILRPTFFCGVPRVFTKVYDVIMKTINRNPSTIIRNIAHKAIETKLYNYEKYGVLTHVIYDKLVFNKIKNTLGGRIRWMLVGSAPMPSDVLKFLRIAFCCPITEGYGQTEDCAGVLLANVNDTSAGHLGGVSGCCELKLIDVPELGYTTKDKNEKGEWEPRGEICIRGTNVFKGYYKDEKLTEETMKYYNGKKYYVTGNIGFLDKDRYFTLIGRASRFFIINTLNKVYCELVQQVVSNIDVVDSCAIVPKPNEETLYKCKAYVVLKPGITASKEIENYIISKCKETYIDPETNEETILKDYEIPESVNFLETLPRTNAAEKIDYEKLKKMAEEEYNYEKGKTLTKHK